MAGRIATARPRSGDWAQRLCRQLLRHAGMVRLFQYQGVAGRTGKPMTSRAAGLIREPRDPQRATFLELFFDLVFVLALAQLSRGLIQHLSWSGAFQTLVLLMAFWWVWAHMAGLTDIFDPQRPQVQLLVTASMLGGLVLAAVTPEAFGRRGLVFAGAYLAIQLGRCVFVVLVLRGHEAQRLFLRQLLWFSVSALPWIAGALAQGSARAALWTLAVVVDSTALGLRYPAPGLGRASSSEFAISGGHLAERYRQIFIIALGELILVAGLAFSGSGLGADRSAALVVSFATTVLLWRIYIFRAGELLGTAIGAARDPLRVGLPMVYSHVVMVAGIVVTAVGQELVIAHPLAHARSAWTAVILGGPALFLAGRAIFEYATFARVSRDRPIGLLLLAAVTPVMLHLPPLLAATAATAVLAAIAIADASRARRHPPELPSPPGGPP
ncbi:low temperature requirement protein A [Micromonospora phytophila]|uniref:low temperature requirement protein A n=1 Tax=Micromonospora phytophila TaxID=709888 RepID=UPI00202FF194|nr:low temperature requirement protein A [Micromonospora phytophila]MCM0673496.1 low temperature requirement protein A [Micromonospora phytophila]